MGDRPGTPIPPHHPHCLGCGPLNVAGMGLELRLDEDFVRGEVCFDRRQEGAPGFAHGGAICTVLDDALGTLLLVIRKPAVTANLNVDFRSPAFLNRRLTVEAWSEGVAGRKLYLAGRMLDDSTILAEARGLFVEVEPDHFRRGGADISEFWTGIGPR